MASDLESLTADIWLTNVDTHIKLLESNLDKIPEIGMIATHCLKDGQLVRFRGMIQDMADPVLYLHKYEVINNVTGQKEVRSGKYKDTLSILDHEDLDENSPHHHHCERRSVYCVSVPGLNSWTKPTLSMLSQVPSSANLSDRESTQNKRTAEEMELDEPSTHDSKSHKRVNTGEMETSEQTDILLNHPLESSSNYSCLVNVYEEIDEAEVKMNSVVDVIGFVTFTNHCDDFAHLPATLVPRLHAVYFKRITHSNPFYLPNSDTSAVLLKAEQTRSQILCTLTELFLGDKLSAEYVLCNLISRIYHRTELLALGHFNVNLTKIPLNGYPEEIYNVLKELVPKSHYLPMTLEKMNSQKFLPEKDFERNCLKSGILQLSDHTHLFIDETKMEAGQLNANGVLNVRALNTLVTDQKLDYDFRYLKIEIPIDIPIIVLSEGKSMLSTNVQVILSPGSGTTVEQSLNNVKSLLNETFLTEIRNYLSVIPHLEFNLAEDVIETIQQSYAKLRQEDATVNESDLHLLLVFSRLLSLSYGRTRLTEDMWNKAFQMEIFRKERLTNREP